MLSSRTDEKQSHNVELYQKVGSQPKLWLKCISNPEGHLKHFRLRFMSVLIRNKLVKTRHLWKSFKVKTSADQKERNGSFGTKRFDESQDSWGIFLWMDETKVELSERCTSNYIWLTTNEAFQKKNIGPTDDWRLSFCFRTWMTCSIGWSHFGLWQKVLKENASSSVCDCKLMFLKEKGLEWPSQMWSLESSWDAVGWS